MNFYCQETSVKLAKDVDIPPSSTLVEFDTNSLDIRTLVVI